MVVKGKSQDDSSDKTVFPITSKLVLAIWSITFWSIVSIFRGNSLISNLRLFVIRISWWTVTLKNMYKKIIIYNDTKYINQIFIF